MVDARLVFLPLLELDETSFADRERRLGYHYIASVTLEIYRAPLEQLVDEMGKALKSLRVSS